MTTVFDAALSAVQPKFIARPATVPFPENYWYPIHRDDMPAIKAALRAALPDIKPTLRLEFIARLAAYNTSDAMWAAFKTPPHVGLLFTGYWDDDAFDFVDRKLRETVGGPETDPRSWVMSYHLLHIVASWVARERFAQPHPETDEELLQSAEDFDGNVEGAMLFDHIMRSKKLGDLIALPGKTMTSATRNMKSNSLEESLGLLSAAYAFGVAVDATTHQGSFEFSDIPLAAETGELIDEHDDEVLGFISRPTQVIVKVIDMIGAAQPDLVYDRFGNSRIRDLGALDAACFALSSADGLPGSLWALSTASLLLATEIGNMPLEVASRRLFGEDDKSVTTLLPDRDWSQAQRNWRERIPQVSELIDMSPQAAEATYAKIMDEHWERRPLLDFWLETLDGASGSKPSRQKKRTALEI